MDFVNNTDVPCYSEMREDKVAISCAAPLAVLRQTAPKYFAYDYYFVVGNNSNCALEINVSGKHGEPLARMLSMPHGGVAAADIHPIIWGMQTIEINGADCTKPKTPTNCKDGEVCF